MTESDLDEQTVKKKPVLIPPLCVVPSSLFLSFLLHPLHTLVTQNARGHLMDTAEDIMKMDKENVTTSNSAALET